MNSGQFASLIPLILSALFFIGGLYFAWRKEGQTAAILIIAGAILSVLAA